MTKVLPINLAGEVHEDYIGCDTREKYKLIELKKERKRVIDNINAEIKHLNRVNKLLKEYE